MEFSEVVRRRRMIRHYTDEPLDPAVVETRDALLEKAQRLQGSDRKGVTERQ